MPLTPEDRINQNVETIASLHARNEELVSPHQRGVERITAGLGSPRTLYFIGAAVAAWVALNTLAPRLGLPMLDPLPFNYLQGLIGLAALLMTTMVLTTQNRQTKQAEQRAHLDLQVNLLAEQKIAKVVALLEELRRDIPTVPDRVDPIAEVMTEPLDPQALMSALEQTFDIKGEPPAEAEKGSAGSDAGASPQDVDHPEKGDHEGRA